MPKPAHRGFSLVEVLIAAAVMAIVAVGAAQLASFNLKSQRSVQDASDLNSFGSSLQQLMTMTAACKANLALRSPAVKIDTTQPPSVLQPVLSEIDYPMPAPSASPGVLLPNPANPLIAVGSSYGGWNVSQMGVRVQGPAGIVAPGVNAWFVTLEIDFKKKTDANNVPLSPGNATNLRQSATLTVNTAGTGVVPIVDCGANTVSANCASLGGTLNPQTGVCAYFGGGGFFFRYAYKILTYVPTPDTAPSAPEPGSPCGLPNPLTGACTCPPGYPAVVFDFMFANWPCTNGYYGPGGAVRGCGTMKYQCVPPNTVGSQPIPL